MDRVLITGASGAIGSRLAKRLLARDIEVHGLGRAPSCPDALADVLAPDAWHHADVRDGERMEQLVAHLEPDTVFHLASTPFNPATIPASEHRSTILGGTGAVLDAVLVGAPSARIVLAGSAAECGSGAGRREDDPLRPGTVLGACKAGATLLAQSYARAQGLHTTVIRLWTPYGPGESPNRLVAGTILAGLKGHDFAMSAGTQERDFLFIDDALDALCLAATRPIAAGEIIHVGSGKGTRVVDVVTRILERMGNPCKPLVGALATRPDEIMQMSADITRARRLLAWTPTTSLDEGIDATIRYWRAATARVAL